MELWVLSVVLATTAALHLTDTRPDDPCKAFECRAGRECQLIADEPQCVCATSCPDHFSPVCGSDGVSYDSHCLLHRNACIKDKLIKIDYKGFCRKKTKINSRKSDVEGKGQKKMSLLTEEDNEILNNISNKKAKSQPAACYSTERDNLRDLVIQYWEITLKSQPWHAEGMTYRESLWARYFTCDTDKNNYLSPDEFFGCVDDVPFVAQHTYQDDTLTKALCIDALVDDGDKDQDWRLDFEEFTHVMDPLYHPPPKECSLEGKKYKDGKEVEVKCNSCVCAVGNWVCTSHRCEDEVHPSGIKNSDEVRYSHYNTIEEKDAIGKKESDNLDKKLSVDDDELYDIYDYDEMEDFYEDSIEYDDDEEEDYEEPDDEYINDEDNYLNEDKIDHSKKKLSIWEEFLKDRVAKRQKHQKNVDPWDEYILRKMKKNKMNKYLTGDERSYLQDNTI